MFFFHIDDLLPPYPLHFHFLSFNERLAGIEVETLEDVGIDLDDLLPGEAHPFVGVIVVAAEGERLLDRLVNDDGETGLVGITKLFIETADNCLRALDQVIVFQNQVSAGRVGIQIP